MLGIFAKSFMTATGFDHRDDRNRRPDSRAEPRRWTQDDLPFRRFAQYRSGLDD